MTPCCCFSESRPVLTLCGICSTRTFDPLAPIERGMACGRISRAGFARHVIAVCNQLRRGSPRGVSHRVACCPSDHRTRGSRSKVYTEMVASASWDAVSGGVVSWSRIVDRVERDAQWVRGLPGEDISEHEVGVHPHLSHLLLHFIRVILSGNGVMGGPLFLQTCGRT